MECSVFYDLTEEIFRSVKGTSSYMAQAPNSDCCNGNGCKAGVAFSKSYVGYIHVVAHSLGGQYNIPHGLANSVLMPIVLEEYGECVHKKLYENGKTCCKRSESSLSRS